MGVKFANSAYATLASSITSSATSITLTTGQGARFPSLSGSDYFYATLIDTSNNLEIVKCTARSTDVLTVVRGQESTTARAYSAGDRIELRVTAAGLTDLISGLDGDRGDITVSGSGLVWAIDNLAVTDAKINSMAATKLTGTIDKARMFAGAVLQVQSNYYPAPYTYVSNQSNATTAFSVSITPRATTSSILVMLFTSYYCAGTTYKLRLFRNGTQIAQGNANGSNQQAWMYLGNHSDANQAYQASGAFIDSPSTTSAISYTTAVINDNAATIYFNRPEASGTGVTEGRTSTTMVAIEIAG